MSNLAGQAVDGGNISNLRDILSSYNKITEACFNRCVLNLNQRDLHPDEEQCVRYCAGKFISGNHRIMSMFMQIQTNRQKTMMEEAQKEMEQQQVAAQPTGASSGVDLGAAAEDTDSQAPAISNKDTLDKLQQLFGAGEATNTKEAESSPDAAPSS